MPAPTQIILRSAIVPTELAFQTPKKLIEDLPRYLSGTLEGSDNLYLLNYGFDTPGVDGQAYPWIRLDEFGKPIGTWVYYNGAWVRDWGVTIGSLMPYTGDEADIPDGWIICDGNNGTPDLSSQSTAGGGPPDWDITWIYYVGYA